jgi:uncharacterized surface protein with fasciclin (FAS1) repeats
LINLAGLDEIFNCPGPFTAMVPTNEAFAQVDPDILGYLLDPSNSEKLREVLLYHLLPGSFPSTSLSAGPLATIQGDDVLVKIDPLMFNNATVLIPDLPSCNGLIDSIDEVLLLPGMDSGKYQT